jgi:hypothetical protein
LFPRFFQVKDQQRQDQREYQRIDRFFTSQSSRSINVATESKCAKAAGALGLTWSGSWSYGPKCYIHGSEVYYNSSGTAIGLGDVYMSGLAIMMTATAMHSAQPRTFFDCGRKKRRRGRDVVCVFLFSWGGTGTGVDPVSCVASSSSRAKILNTPLRLHWPPEEKESARKNQVTKNQKPKNTQQPATTKSWGAEHKRIHPIPPAVVAPWSCGATSTESESRRAP